MAVTTAGGLGAAVSLAAVLLLGAYVASASAGHSWDKPGCHLVDYATTIREPLCAKTKVVTKACRGYCESYTVPLPAIFRGEHPHREILTRGRCCSIQSSEDVRVSLDCLYGRVEKVLKSALKCVCSTCKTLQS